MKQQKLIVLSIDAMIEDDLEEAKRLPTFNNFILNGAMTKGLKSVYPTMTYACHTAMSTGCYPYKNGITNNYQVIPGKLNLPWFWFRDAVQCQDIFDACKRKNLTTAAVGWPVTGNHKNIDYLVDEIWPYETEDTAENYKNAYLQSGTSPELYEKAVAPYIDLRVGRKQPQSSFFLINVACEIIKAHQPDLMLIHIGHIDKYRHLNGVYADKIKEGIIECEPMLEKLVKQTKDCGIYEQTNFVITSDHGQIDVEKIFRPNVVLQKHGLITLDQNENVVDWDCWCASADASAQIHFKNPNDESLKKRVYDIFNQISCQKNSGISAVYTAEQTNSKYKLDGDFSLVLETDGSTIFSNEWVGEILSQKDKRTGTHGHNPDLGPCPIFIGCGPAFKKGAIASNAQLVDGAPTYAHVLGTNLPQADGRVLFELLREN